MGFGVMSEPSTDYPGYDNIMTRDRTIGRILKDHGYWTSWFGKDPQHPVVSGEPGRPFDQGPTGMGFDYFYSFVGGDANQASRTYGVHDLSIRAGTICDRSSSPTTESALGDPPGDAKLTSWPNDLLKRGGQLTPDEEVLLRQADVFAAYWAYTDEIGRDPACGRYG